MAGIQPAFAYFRYCPGEEQIKISTAICRGRRQAHYPKCHGCQFNDDEKGLPLPAPAQDRARAVSLIESCFRPHDVLGIYPTPLSTDVAWRIGHAAGQYLHGRLRGLDRANPNVRSIIIGRDNRPHSETLEQALIDGISATGIEVLRIGIVDAPRVYFEVGHQGACGGIHVTGGRHEAPFSGFRICGAKGLPIASETGLASIRDIAVRVPRHQTGTTTATREIDTAELYGDFVRRNVIGGNALPRPIKLVVDASGGVAAKAFPAIFDGIAGLEYVPLNFEPGMRPDSAPNPAAPANLAALRRAVKQHRADLGVGFDGDATRCLFVDDKGIAVGADIMAALLARRFIEREPGATIVFDHRFSVVVGEEVQRAGGHPVRERVGHVFIKKTMSERQAVFGADMSGRFYFRDNFFCESGMLAVVHALNLLCESGRRISDLVRPVCRYRLAGPMRFDCGDSGTTIRRVMGEHHEAEVENFDGLTIRYPDWWFNLRPTHDARHVQLTIEARTKKLVEQRLMELEPLLGTRDHEPAKV